MEGLTDQPGDRNVKGLLFTVDTGPKNRGTLNLMALRRPEGAMGSPKRGLLVGWSVISQHLCGVEGQEARFPVLSHVPQTCRVTSFWGVSCLCLLGLQVQATTSIFL